MNCIICGRMAIGGSNRCRACYREQNKRYSRQNTPAITAGYCHAGNEITPIPAATMEKIARMRQEESQRQAKQIATIEDRVKNFFDEIAEDLARDENRQKCGIQAVPTCEKCNRKLIDGECYKCRR